MKLTLTHDFKTPIGVVNIAGAQGFMKCLNQISKHINDKAIRKDNALYVNASELMEIINNTMDELTEGVEIELNNLDYKP